MITAEEVAKMLGISRAAVYDLAAPKGPLRCVRLGRRCLRFNLVDVEAHVLACTHSQSAPKIKLKMSAKSVKVKVRKPMNCFEQLGIVTRPKPKR